MLLEEELGDGVQQAPRLHQPRLDGGRPLQQRREVGGGWGGGGGGGGDSSACGRGRQAQG